MAKHNTIGQEGERIAAEYLINKNYTIIARNYRIGKAEIDLIAQNENRRIFIEVKTRTSAKYGSPDEFITHQKERMIIDAANHWMMENSWEGEFQFDIISIILSEGDPEIQHFPDAFFPGW